MTPVIIAVGSNVGDRHPHLQAAGRFLSSLSAGRFKPSPIYLTEPVGPATRYFLNAVAEITTDLPPEKLIARLKQYESEHGRAPDHSKWYPRTVDLDIVAFGELVINDDSLIIPHSEYTKRLFVLKPLFDIHPDWKDPRTEQNIRQLMAEAESMQVRKTDLNW